MKKTNLAQGSPLGENKSPNENKLLIMSGTALMVIKIVNAGLGFLIVALFARLLEPEAFGVYTLALTLAQFLALPLQMGIPVLLTREISVAIADGNPERVKGVRIWSRRIVFVGTLVMGTLVIGLYATILTLNWPLFAAFNWPIVVLVASLIPVIAEMKRVMGVLNGYRKPVLSRLPDGVVRPLILLLLGGYGLWYGVMDETGLLAVYLFSGAIAAIIGWYLVHNFERREAKANTVEIKSSEWWQSLWPLTILAAATTIKTHVDVLMLGALDTTSSVAFYKVATQIAGIALLAQVAVNAVMSPHIAALYSKKNHVKIQRLAVKGSRIAFGCVLSFAVLILVCGEDSFATVFGPDYIEVFPIAVVLTLGSAASAFFGGTIMMLNMTKREKHSSKYALVAAFANIFLNLLLIPIAGAMGAAMATVITATAMQALAWHRIVHDLGVRTDAFARIPK